MGERLSRLEGGYEHLATKADLANAKAELKADVAEVKTELAQFKSQIDERIARMETRLLLRFGSVAVAAVAAAVGFSRLLG